MIGNTPVDGAPHPGVLPEAPNGNGASAGSQRGRQLHTSFQAASQVFHAQQSQHEVSPTLPMPANVPMVPVVPVHETPIRTPSGDHKRRNKGEHQASGEPFDPKSLQGLIKRLVDSEMNKAPQHVQQEVKKATLRLSQRMEALQRTNARRTKLETEITELTLKTLPKGVQKAQLPYECKSWDSEWKKEKTNILFTVTGDSNGPITFRQAREQIHMAYVLEMKKIEKAISDLQREELRKDTSRSNFLATCRVPTARFELSHSQLDLVDEESDSEGTGHFNPQLFENQLKKVYRGCADKVAAMVMNQALSRERAAEQDDKARQKVLDAGPERLLEQTVDERIASKLSSYGIRSRKPPKKGGKDSNSNLPEGYDYPRLTTQTFLDGMKPDDVENFVKPKNGSSPAGKAGGKSSKNINQPANFSRAQFPKNSNHIGPKNSNGGKLNAGKGKGTSKVNHNAYYNNKNLGRKDGGKGKGKKNKGRGKGKGFNSKLKPHQPAASAARKGKAKGGKHGPKGGNGKGKGSVFQSGTKPRW